MRFLTKVLAESVQRQIAGSEIAWQAAEAAYSAELQRIATKLPAGAFAIAYYVIHDGIIRRVKSGDPYIIELDLSGAIDQRCIGYFYLEIKGYQAASQATYTPNQWIISHEVDLTGDGLLVLRLLTDQSELEFVGRDLIWRELPYGFSRGQGDDLIKDNSEQLLLSRIKHLRTQGKDWSSIASELNDCGTRARYGERWNERLLRLAQRHP